MLQIALQKFESYWADSWHVLLLAIALIYILICVKEKKTKKTFWWYSGLFVAVYVFPLTIKIITMFMGADVYWRMFWVLPTSVIMAFAFTHLYEQVSAKWLRATIFLMMAAVVTLGGAWMYTNSEFEVAPNWHKVSVSVPGVCEAIQEDAAQQGLEQSRIVVDNSLLAEIRQYDASIKMLYGRNALRGQIAEDRYLVYEQMQQAIPDYQQLIASFRHFGVNYVVWVGSEESFAGFIENGFRLVGQVEQYKIYFID